MLDSTQLTSKKEEEEKSEDEIRDKTKSVPPEHRLEDLIKAGAGSPEDIETQEKPIDEDAEKPLPLV